MGGGGCADSCGGWVLQVPVWVIFDYDDVVFAAESVDLAAALEGEDTGGRVLSHAAFC